MDQQQPQQTLLAELDQRQDEVISQLDQLNLRIEQLLGQWGSQREPQLALDEGGAVG